MEGFVNKNWFAMKKYKDKKEKKIEEETNSEKKMMKIKKENKEEKTNLKII